MQDRLIILARKLQTWAKRLAPKSLMVRYTLALTAIAALMVLEQMMVQVTMQRQAEGQRLMRLVDRQQLESTRLARAALSTQLANGDGELHAQLRALLDVALEIQTVHKTLFRDLSAYQNSAFSRSLEGRETAVADSYQSLGLAALMNWQKRLEKSPPTARTRYALREAVQSVRTGAQEYHERLEQLLTELDRVIQEQYRSARRIEFFLFTLLLAVLLIEGLYIFRPSIRGLESALRTRSDFMSRMSHEIRNPMNAIMGMTDVLKETPLSDLQKRYLSTLEKSSHTLLELLNSLLDFSALESGKTQIEKITLDLMELLGKVVDVSAVRAHDKRLDVVLEIDPRTPVEITGDPVRLQQVLSNLLSNAIKFTETGEVRLSVRPELRSESEQYLLFSVVDTGIGINTRSLARIFDSFVQAESSTRRKYGGTGLGLTIAKELVQLMGGQLSVSSEVGRGSEFKFSLPIGAPSLDSRTLGEVLSSFDLRGFTALCLGPMKGPMAQAADLVRLCGGRIETRIEAVDLASAKSIVLISPEDDDSLVQFFPESFPPQARILCILGTVAPAQRMRAFINFGVTEFMLAPLKPVDFIRALARTKASLRPTLAPAPHDPALERRLRLLVADDSPENRDLIRLYLSRENVDVEFASDGAQAIHLFQTRPDQKGSFDLVLMDIQMPIIDGTEAFTSIRQWEASRSLAPTPIIAITADDRIEQRQDLLHRGFSALLIKPLRKSQLLSLISASRAAGRNQDRFNSLRTTAQPQLPSHS